MKLRRDNYPPNVDKWSILVAPEWISFHSPNGGKWVEIPRAEFDALIRWYFRDQKPRNP